MLLRRMQQIVDGEENGTVIAPSPSPLKPAPPQSPPGESPARNAQFGNPLFFMTDCEVTASPGNARHGELPAGYIEHAAKAFATAVSTPVLSDAYV